MLYVTSARDVIWMRDYKAILRPSSWFAIVLAPMLFWAGSASAQSGKEDFRHYCAACHGENGKGGASWNGTKVPDLTRLRQAHGGNFPSEEVAQVVDGRSRVLWHQRQPGEMPYWGDVFHLEEEQLGKAKAEPRIMAIVDCIRSVQEKMRR